MSQKYKKERLLNTRPQLRSKTFGWGDLVIIFLFLIVLIYFVRKIILNQGNLEWSAIPQFIFYFEEDTGRLIAGTLLKGLLVTIKLGVWASILGFILGTILALGRISSRPYLILTSRTIIETARNLPPMVLIFLFFYFISEQFIPWPYFIKLIQAQNLFWQKLISLFFSSPDQFKPFFSAVLVLAIYEGAYFAEIIRGGILSIAKEQWEASFCLGLNTRQRLRFIIFPQTFRKILPQLAGQFISTVKDSSIVSLIGIQELTFVGNNIVQSTAMSTEVWLTVALMYLILCLLLSVIAQKLELKQIQS